jgi:signal transduction histidine kinase
LESVLAQSEKLAAVGRLAAGVAHEINNPLTAIIANAQILQRELAPEDDLQESVDLIARAGSRATQVVRSLLDIARKDEQHMARIDVNETLLRALALVQHELLARSITLQFEPAPNLPHIWASQDQLQGVWLNLLLNAVDAMAVENTGTESTSTENPPAENGRGGRPSVLRVSTRLENDEILAVVEDSGMGIAPDRLERIFEPFYTTKAPGRGTGLGLSVSERVVKQHGGRIQVESRVDSGSRFAVYLPVRN